MVKGKGRVRALSMETGIQSTNHALLESMYGLINVVILAPVCVSFTNIIFSPVSGVYFHLPDGSGLVKNFAGNQNIIKPTGLSGFSVIG